MKERHIQLTGAHNFRDIGGYNTSHGTTVKTGMIFRSDGLAKLRKSDLKQIEKLAIKLVIDLRSEQERTYQPSRLPTNNAPMIENLSFSDNKIDFKDLYKRTLTGKLGKFDFYEFFLSDYPNINVMSQNMIKN